MRIKTLALFFCAACIAGCSSSESSSSEEEMSQVAHNIIVYEAKHGKHAWVLDAEKAVFNEDKGLVILTKPNVLFKEEDKTSSKIHGDKGTMLMDKKIILLEGSVHGENMTEKTTIKTEALVYDLGQKEIWTDKRVTLNRAGSVVTGAAFKAKADLSEIEIFKQKTQLPHDLKDLGL